MMKGIRRSIKGDKTHTYEPKAGHMSITPKSAITIQPPKKVIKALYDYIPRTDEELGFSRGDFFHVIGRENDSEWYEACNPATNARGLVPVAWFQILGKSERDSSDSSKSLGSLERTVTDTDSGYSDRSTTDRRQARKSTHEKAGGPLYGIVQYDFVAERPDELEAKEGEAVIVIAQSNKEWFVAKPIGRLGGPGLIPVGFIEIRDMVTGLPCEDKDEAIRRAGVPKVEEWKRKIAEYKNSSISLGKFANDAPEQNAMQQDTSYVLAASVDDYSFEGGRYWYLVNCTMEDGRHWALRRFYEDFYDCQITLLKTFPEEAGQNNPASRTLPFMPGPVTFVTDSISSARRASLDEYIKKLLEMPPHISKCQLIRELFTPRPNDIEKPYASQALVSELFPQRNSQISQHSSDSSRELSRQSSGGNLNANNYAGQAPRAPGQRANSVGQAHMVHMRTVSDLQPPRMLREGSTQSTQQQNFIKIKVSYQDEMIALRLPRDVSFSQLQEKLHERLGNIDLSCIQYKDEPSNSFISMISDADLFAAINRNAKLVLYVM
ncbi:hypothetical protein L211DRAFT_874593 [Terfezia boudieri ATCC MYA-4762]|uniref:Uncharacterized protein n=1 Tax=Terfezia boudieri ATCC MYA-4762 TaxID=1051890 RepID=A0A3N4LSY6_9PEZI|nr:hypothetical protein L211DRAFT_874593 [Terfezia boudieri ATCC MYA-4762]